MSPFNVKVVLYLKIFKKFKYFFIEFFNYICYFEPKKSSLDEKFKKFQMICLKEPTIFKMTKVDFLFFFFFFFFFFCRFLIRKHLIYVNVF